MAKQESNLFKVCVGGPKCARKYFDDFERRKAKFGPENQGTGNACKDIEELAKETGIEATAEPSDCFGLCPLPWERSIVEDPAGKIHLVYHDDLRKMFKDWKNNIKSPEQLS